MVKRICFHETRSGRHDRLKEFLAYDDYNGKQDEQGIQLLGKHSNYMFDNRSHV